ncbi:MAG: hypothetical protein QM692_10525 [Thermomicrobiales bacterium]
MVTQRQEDTDRLPSILPAAEGRRLFDFEARRVTGLSGEEFLRRYDAGEIVEDDDSPAGRDVLGLIMLIPFGRQDD